MVGLAGYQMDRIRAWLDPWKYADTIGYHTVQGLLALGLGGVFGSGLGESRMAGGLFVPNAFNDFIFAIIGEEFGLVGAGVVIALFVLLAYAGIRVALGAPDTFGALLAAGITAWLCIQAFINIGVVVTLVPITGITLPFISAGGSSLIISFAAIGILLSISRETIEKGTWNDDATADRRAAERAGTSTRRWPSPARCARDTDGAELSWLGGHRGLEAGIVPAAGIPFRRLALRSLRSVEVDVHVVLDPLRLGASVPAGGRDARRASGRPRSSRPAATSPSRSSSPPPRSASRSCCGTATSIPGRAVRATARLADVLAVSFEATCADPRVGGARPAVLRDRHADPRHDGASTARRRARGSASTPGTRVLLVFGGSQAVRRFNAAVAEALPALVERAVVIHVTGDDGYAAALAGREALPADLRDRYRPHPFLRDDMLTALAAADLVVGRAGSSTLAEVTALGLPIVVVPYPHAAGHQRANARQLVEAGAGRLIDDADFDAAALLEAARLLDDPAAHVAMSAAAARSAGPGAADAVADLVLAAARRDAAARPGDDRATIARGARMTAVAAFDAIAVGSEIQRRVGVKTSRDEPLARFTTMRVGGPADLFATVHNLFELRALVRFARDARRSRT